MPKLSQNFIFFRIGFEFYIIKVTVEFAVEHAMKAV